MVYNDEQIRWMEEQTRKQRDPAKYLDDSPEWYLRKFMDRTITPKQASSLLVSLRSKEIGWMKHFVSLRGTAVLAQTLRHIGQSSRRYVAFLAFGPFDLTRKLDKKMTFYLNTKLPSASNIYSTIPYYLLFISRLSPGTHGSFLGSSSGSSRTSSNCNTNIIITCHTTSTHPQSYTRSPCLPCYLA
jgi:hypothetical protein